MCFFGFSFFFFSFLHMKVAELQQRAKECVQEREREKCKEKLELPFIVGYKGGYAERGSNI